MHASASTARLIRVEGLTTRIQSGDRHFSVVDDVSFAIDKGKTLALLGESGCGKSMTALSIMGLLPKPVGRVSSGRVLLEQDDLMAFSEQQMRSVRGKRIGMIFQEPMTSLNPVLTVGEQISEVLKLHLGLPADQANARVLELLNSVRIPDAEHQINNYPHQLSGGMKQRVMIALALAAEPDLLIADEPTTALDVTTQAQVLALIKSLQQSKHMAILLITHDLGIVSQMADEVAVMYAGELVEICPRQQFFRAPMHPYSRALFNALPAIHKRQHALNVIKGGVPALDHAFSGCRFANRCEQALPACSQQVIDWQEINQHQVRCINSETEIAEQAQRRFAQADSAGKTLIRIEDLKVHFPIRKGLFKRTVGRVHAVDGVSLEVEQGKTLALVGESGCGKTTVGKSILRLIETSGGTAHYLDQDLLQLSDRDMKDWRAKLQFVFQDPFSSMIPRMLILDILAEGMKALKVAQPEIERRSRGLLELVGLDSSALYRYPHEFSGGQRQRISIARALAVNPEFIVCDEPTSALDVSVQAQILNLLRDLQQQLGLSYLFITHNISVVSYGAQQVAVMYLGRIVEQGTVDQVLNQPRHPYTRALLQAVPELHQGEQPSTELILEGEIPSAINPPRGCYFHQRCPQVMDVCRQQYPPTIRIDGHDVSCFLYQNNQT